MALGVRLAPAVLVSGGGSEEEHFEAPFASLRPPSASLVVLAEPSAHRVTFAPIAGYGREDSGAFLRGCLMRGIWQPGLGF